MSNDLQAIGQSGVAALRRGDAAAARAAFDRVEAAGRGTHQLRLLLAQACTLLRDAPAAHRALDRVLADEPANLYALVMRGDLIAHAGDARAAVSWYQAALRQAPRAGQLPADLIEALRRAERAVADAGAGFQAHLDAAVAPVAGAAGPRFAEALDILAGVKQPFVQQPTSFYYPGLPNMQFYDPAGFPWMAGMVAAVPAMLTELHVLLADETGMQPYVEAPPDRPAKAHPLLDDPQWSAFHLWKGGEPVAGNAARCPATMAALAEAPIPRIRGRSPMALFSVLRQGTHIPPHNGMLNTRLICHIPLVVPDGCRLRVGNDVRPVAAGVPMIFDDSIEHEAWNDGAGTRVVLLFEVWRPELSAAERAALTTAYEAIGDYGGMAEG